MNYLELEKLLNEAIELKASLEPKLELAKAKNKEFTEKTNLEFSKLIKDLNPNCPYDIESSIEITSTRRSSKFRDCWYAYVTVTSKDMSSYGIDIRCYIYDNHVEVNYGTYGAYSRKSSYFDAVKVSCNILENEDKIIEFCNNLDLTITSELSDTLEKYRDAEYDINRFEDEIKYEKALEQINVGAVFEADRHSCFPHLFVITKVMPKTIEYSRGYITEEGEISFYTYAYKAKRAILINEICEDIVYLYNKEN